MSGGGGGFSGPGQAFIVPSGAFVAGAGLGLRRNQDFISGAFLPAPAPPVDMNFAVGTYVGVIGLPTAFLNTVRASPGTAVDASGNWTSFGNNVPRITNLGLLVEELVANWIRNNTMQGAVAGTPGTPPTNWSIGATVNGLTSQIVAVGVTNGIDRIDVRWTGTATATGINNYVFFDANNNIAASNGQIWTGSTFLSLIAGSLAGVTSAAFRLRFNNSSGTLVTSQDTSFLGAGAAFNRITNTLTATDGTTAFVNTQIALGLTASTVYDFTLRFGWPQLEALAAATSPILTTAGAVLRQADVIKMTTSPVFGSSYSMLGTGIANDPTTYASDQSILQVNLVGDGSQRTLMRKQNTTAQLLIVAVGGTGYGLTPAGTWPTGVLSKIAVGAAPGSQAAAFNGGTPVTSAAAALPTTPSEVYIGQENGGNWFDGYVSRVAIWPTFALSAQQVQQVTT